MHDSDFEPVDNTPVAMPTRLRLPQTRTDQLRAFIREEMSRRAHEQGHDSFEDAEDIEPDDEEELPMSAYEQMLLEPPAQDPTPPVDGVKAEGQPPVDPAAKQEGSPPAQPEADDGP